MPLESRQELSRLFFLTIFNQDSRRSIILLPDHLIKHHVVPNPKWYIPIQRTEPPGLVLTLLILLRGLPWLSAASASRRTFYVPCLASTRLTGPYIAPPPSPPPGRTHANATAPTPRTLPNSYRGIPREPGGERERVCTATAWTEESRTSAAFHPRPTRAFTGLRLRLRLRLPTRMRMRLRTRPGRLLRSPCATAVERRGKAGKARAPFPQTRRALLFLHWWKQKKMFGRSVI